MRMMEDMSSSQRVVSTSSPQLQDNSIWSKDFHGLENILSRLPIFTVLQCRRVCSAWNNLISNWSFRRLWSERNRSKDSWIVLVHRDLRISSIIFYNVSIDEWHVKELDMLKIFESNGPGYAINDLNWSPCQTPAEGLLISMHEYNNPSTEKPELSIQVLNPFNNCLRLISPPLSTVNIMTNSAVAILNVVDDGSFDRVSDGRQIYKIMVTCYQEDEHEWTLQIYNSVNDTWMAAPLPPASETFRTFYVEDKILEYFMVQRFSRVRSSSWDAECEGRMFNFAIVIWIGGFNPEYLGGCVDLLSYDSEEDTSFRLCIPWTWDIECKPRMLFGIIQRGNILIAPYVEVNDHFECVAIKINTLEMKYGTSDMYQNDEVWDTKAVMPDELFESLHRDEERKCNLAVVGPCFKQLKCLTDDNTDQLLFFSSITSQIVAYCFSPSSPDEVWVSLRYPVWNTRLNGLLRSEDLVALMYNFQFRPDRVA